jgi:FKBP-type peptidyl-prolyl cis-trans isomerase SlyD
MKNSKGDILENRLQAKPVEYLHGSDNILPALQCSLTGLLPGAQASISISNKQGLLLDDDFYFDVVIDGVRPATEDEIKKGKPVKVEIKEDCGDDCDCYKVDI